MRILFIRYNKKTIQNENTFIRHYLEKNRFKIKLILKRVTHKINRINNFVVNVISFLIFYLVVVSAP